MAIDRSITPNSNTRAIWRMVFGGQNDSRPLVWSSRWNSMACKRAVIVFILVMAGTSGWSPWARFASPGLGAQEALPGNPGRMAYERGMLEMIRGNQERAISEFRKALSGGGSYADLSRLMLVRLLSREGKADPNDEIAGEVIQFISTLEDQQLMPLAWFAMLQSLRDSGRVEASLRYAQEFAVRFREHALCDDSLLLAARMLYERREFGASHEMLYRLYETAPLDADRRPEARLLEAQLYLSDWDQASSLRGCSLLRGLDPAEGLAPALYDRVRTMQKLHCSF
ncbi:MAG: hypothetical protein KDK39_04025 [Leptospiraceae bacterium]|nr:hypothetical protein [Leptospiraceae bacterium]